MILPSENYELLYDSVIEHVRLDCNACVGSGAPCSQPHVIGWPSDVGDVLEAIERHELAFHTVERKDRP